MGIIRERDGQNERENGRERRGKGEGENVRGGRWRK